MSKFSESIYALMSHNKKGVADINPYFVDHATFDDTRTVDRYNTIISSRFSVERTTTVDSALMENDDFADMVHKSIKREMVWAVFGEFYEPMMGLMLVIMEGKTEKAVGMIKEIVKDMFSSGD